MKSTNNKNSSVTYSLTFVICIFSSLNSNSQIQEAQKSSDIEKVSEIIWNVKAFHPNAELINIKAIDKYGKIHDVKAIQNSDDTSVLDVKALINGKRLPIKLLVNKYERYMPLKAIDEDGTIIDVKGITQDGQILDVKGVSKSGNIIHVRAITKTGDRYNIIAISPNGIKNDVKGIKLLDSEVEAIIHGVEIFAHVKSISQRN